MCAAPETGTLELLSGERLLLRTFRRLGLGANCDLFRLAFEEACGPAGPEAFRALAVLVGSLALSGTRRIELAHPASRGITADERRLLDAFAYAQADLYAWAERRLGEILGRDPHMPLVAAVDLVSQAFLHSGLLLRADCETEVATLVTNAA